MKVLIVGGGGREHALAWKVAESLQVNEVFVAPGNAGTANEPKVSNIDIGAEEIDALLDFAKKERIEMTVVGPEAPLTEGIVNRFQEQGLRCFGPSKEAAQLEGSKDFTKQFLVRNQIPTASYQTFESVSDANRYIEEVGAPIVVKADGLAAGKGVIVAESVEQAKQAVSDMLEHNRFGTAGSRVVIEECLEGEEASFICIVDGEDVLPLATSQDHKRALDGDLGPNTGGMGAYSPAPIIDAKMEYIIMTTIIQPTVSGLLREGIRYTGFLYAGLMISPEGVPQVLEFNCRMGDPETQPIMVRLKSDLVDLLSAALNGSLGPVSAEWDPRAALGVVIASGGYPGSYRKGATISGFESPGSNQVKVFHAGTAMNEVGEFTVSGGRVLCVTALGENIAASQHAAYDSIKTIHFEDMHFRTDIGARALHGTTTSTL
ncbi:MAG: phosphoribosylamine--glycine ligase [Gammaproteobacteria bacterium]|nr:phosphoribosylamine--glycine ligase [Gammaproteobacteria bacterium]